MTKSLTLFPFIFCILLSCKSSYSTRPTKCKNTILEVEERTNSQIKNTFLYGDSEPSRRLFICPFDYFTNQLDFYINDKFYYRLDCFEYIAGDLYSIKDECQHIRSMGCMITDRGFSYTFPKGINEATLRMVDYDRETCLEVKIHYYNSYVFVRYDVTTKKYWLDYVMMDY